LEPPSDPFAGSGVEVSINPELGFDINGARHLIKLYFKAPELTKRNVDLVTHLMSVTLQTRCDPRTTMSVLDVRRGKIFSPTVPIPALTSLVHAELAYIATLW